MLLQFFYTIKQFLRPIEILHYFFTFAKFCIIFSTFALWSNLFLHYCRNIFIAKLCL